jgi:hypothetical protein
MPVIGLGIDIGRDRDARRGCGRNSNVPAINHHDGVFAVEGREIGLDAESPDVLGSSVT